MQFRLKTLLALMTVCGIILAIVLYRIRQRERLEEHRQSFRELDSVVSQLEPGLIDQLLRQPSLMERLRQNNPVDPKMGLSQSVMGEAMFFDRYSFKRQFVFGWQLPSGEHYEGVDVLVSSTIDEKRFGTHVVELTYEPSELNRVVADWIEQQLGKQPGVKVQHVASAGPENVGLGSPETTDSGTANTGTEDTDSLKPQAVTSGIL